jgi:hypothetical protein
VCFHRDKAFTSPCPRALHDDIATLIGDDRSDRVDQWSWMMLRYFLGRVFFLSARVRARPLWNNVHSNLLGISPELIDIYFYPMIGRGSCLDSPFTAALHDQRTRIHSRQKY